MKKKTFTIYHFVCYYSVNAQNKTDANLYQKNKLNVSPLLVHLKAFMTRTLC